MFLANFVSQEINNLLLWATIHYMYEVNGVKLDWLILTFPFTKVIK